MEAAIRFSQNSLPGQDKQKFLKVDVTGKVFALCNITKSSRHHALYETLHTSTKVPAFRAFDWHPVDESIIAVGSAGGEATLLSIANDQQDAMSFVARSQRPCNAVALSSQNLIASGLEKVRTDFCLNIWDCSQRAPTGPTTVGRFTQSHNEPLHKLAGGEAIMSLKFFNNDPQLLMTGVKDKFVRLYDLRAPNGNSGLQFATKCTSNIAIDHLDDNYFASCFASTDPVVCLWDKRMSPRSNTSAHGNYVQYPISPEPSIMFENVNTSPANIWSLRFSKFKRGCLGVLSSDGHLRVYETGRDFVGNDYDLRVGSEDPSPIDQNRSKDVYLRRTQDIEQAFNHVKGIKDAQKRIVSFDFMTSCTRSRQPKIIVLTGVGTVRLTALKPDPEPAAISSTGFVCKGLVFQAVPSTFSHASDVSMTLSKIRRTAEPRNALKQAYKTSKQIKSVLKEKKVDLRRMSSFANHCWYADLGYYEKTVSLQDLMTLLAAARLRCEAGYLLDASKNKALCLDSQWLESFWNWIDRAERISKNKNMLQDNLDLSFVGVHSIWMEEIAISHRQTGASFAPISSVIKNLVSRLNLPPRKGAHTEYPWHRKLCLHVSGLGWSREELETVVQKLVASNQHTKAAATAIFSDEEKIAYKALRAKTSTQSHKMLAMAIAGAKRGRSTSGTAPASKAESESETTDDDWAQTITSLSADLTDPYARAILAYVKSGSWLDVVNENALPLKQRMGVALRHLSDSELTEFLGRMTRQVISAGNIEGVILTGTGSREGLELLQAYAAKFHDIQTAVLGLSVGGAAGRFIGSQQEEKWSHRKLDAAREVYRTMIMSWGLKFDRVRFDIAYSRALQISPSPPSSVSGTTSTNIAASNRMASSRPRQQMRLICTHCSQSLTQFPNGGTASEANQGIQYTAKNPLTPEKAAVLGTVCPRCGRHLPRCGVCDLWLGVPDETFARYQHTTTPPNGTVIGSGTAEASSRLGSTSAPSGKAGRGRGTGLGITRHPASRSVSVASRNNVDDMTASQTASEITTIGPSTTGAKNSNSTPSDSHGRISAARDSQFLGSHTVSTSSSASVVAAAGGGAIASDSTSNEENRDNKQVERKYTDQPDNKSVEERQKEKQEMERKWAEVMHKFTVFCVRCTHGFHAEHARLWFEGGGGGREGHRVCPVPGCTCTCNG